MLVLLEIGVIEIVFDIDGADDDDGAADCDGQFVSLIEIDGVFDGQLVLLIEIDGDSDIVADSVFDALIEIDGKVVCVDITIYSLFEHSSLFKYFVKYPKKNAKIKIIIINNKFIIIVALFLFMYIYSCCFSISVFSLYDSIIIVIINIIYNQ